jgi:two-component system sensor histidine kinase TctE
MADAGKASYSLRRMFLFRLLVFLVPLALVTLGGAYLVTLHYANVAFDRSLARRVYALADQVEVVRGRVVVDLPQTAHNILEFDPTDVLYFRVIGPAGEHLAGSEELSLPRAELLRETGRLKYFDTRLDNDRVRVAAYKLSLKGTQAKGSVTILAGETTAKRTKLADEILLTVLLPMIVVVGLMIYAVSLAVDISLKPVRAIREAIARRGTHDLNPIELQGLPAEIEPLLAEMNRLVGDLRALHDSRQRFLADSAHQLRTPLASMRAQTELAIRSVQDPASRQALAGLLASLDRQTRLVNQLLALSRAENALADPVWDDIRLDEMARNVAAEWVPRALERGIDLAFESVQGPVWMRGNVHALTEALANLLDNALRYCRTGDHVTVRVYVEGERVCLAVSDTGPGVPGAALPKLFERFYRVPGSQTEGCGLGLAIVRQVAMAYDGEASASNRQEGGLEVSMCFPPLDMAGQ